MIRLPAIPGVTIALDETGDIPALVVTSDQRLSREAVAQCHRLAGELGATIEIRTR